MVDDPLQTINILGTLLEPTQRKLKFLLQRIKEEQDKYSIICEQLMKEQDNIQNDKTRQQEFISYHEDIEESQQKNIKIDSAASTKKNPIKHKKYKRQKRISKFDKSLIKTHQRFGNRLKKIIFYEEIPDGNPDQLNHMLESSDCDFPIIDEMAKVIEDGAGNVNPDYLIYLIGIDVYNPYLEQLFKNEFYSAAMKSVNKIQGQSQYASEDVDNQEVDLFVQENNNQERKNLKQIIYQFYNKKKQQLFVQLKVLLKLTGRIWVIQKQSLTKIMASNLTQSSFSKMQSQQLFQQSNHQKNQKSIKNQQMFDDKQNTIFVTKVSKSKSISKNRISSLKQPEQMIPNRIESTKSKIRNKNKNFFCKYCEKYFKLQWSLDEHVKCYHPNHSIYMETEEKIEQKDELFDQQLQNDKNDEQ